MSTSCAMMSSRVTPPIEEKEADVDGDVEAGGITVLNRLKHSCVSLRLTVAASMAYMTWKWLETGKGIEKWRRILVITKGKNKLITNRRIPIHIYNRKNKM